MSQQIPQDLHIHTTFSYGDSSVVKEQTLEFILELRYARITGIYDAHQPGWMNQTIARHVAHQLGIKETILF